ncbi:MAG: hypothetical protein ACI9SC_001522 [Gammaproteobacteria bacterium]|jgi:hypothetical protein
MAGGEFGKTVVCNSCLLDAGELNPAERSGEGIEVDLYLCEKGHKVGIHWDTESCPNSPLWPPSDKYTKMAVVIKEELAKATGKSEILRKLVELDLIPD